MLIGVTPGREGRGHGGGDGRGHVVHVDEVAPLPTVLEDLGWSPGRQPGHEQGGDPRVRGVPRQTRSVDVVEPQRRHPSARSLGSRRRPGARRAPWWRRTRCGDPTAPTRRRGRAPAAHRRPGTVGRSDPHRDRSDGGPAGGPARGARSRTRPPRRPPWRRRRRSAGPLPRRRRAARPPCRRRSAGRSCRCRTGRPRARPWPPDAPRRRSPRRTAYPLQVAHVVTGVGRDDRRSVPRDRPRANRRAVGRPMKPAPPVSSTLTTPGLGSRSSKRQPPATLLTAIRPSCASTTPRAMASPRPAPPSSPLRDGVPRQPTSKTRPRFSSGIPPQPSITATRTRPSSARSAISRTVSSGWVCRTALATRFPNARARSSAEPNTDRRSRGGTSASRWTC